jgi:hypothetical protein
MVEHHVEEEEKEFFPEVEESLGDEQLEELGQRMEQRFEKAREEDFRVPLHDNLQQVLEGALKPRKAKGKPTSGKQRKSA